MIEEISSGAGSGAGSRLPTVVLTLAGVSTVVAVVVSAMSIYLHLKNYRKPILQRMVIRIMVMVPIYAVSSLIALFSLEAAFVIDAIRDIYEAFVIYCFFVLLLSYLGGERSLLILLHGWPPKAPVFPVSLFRREIDVSDPYTFLFLKRGILQYVQVKPVLAAVTLILKACGKFNEGDFRADSGYLYVSIVYNTSICLSLYCLAVFWLCVNDDLKPFRPVPKFLCVKGILFFSFWQSIAVSVFVAAGVIKKLGPYTDAEHISLGLTDTLICLEMPFFAFLHMYAFSHTDYIDPLRSYVARMPMYYAFRDAFGLLDVVEDSKATLRGEGMDYREFEPAEGVMHQGIGRTRRIRAGLRYSKKGEHKYWLPQPAKPAGRFERGVDRLVKTVGGGDQDEEVHAPLFARDAEDTVHLAPDLQDPHEDADIWDSRSPANKGYELPFGDLDDDDEELFAHSKRYLFGDYNYPCIDISSEDARTTMWDEEERVLRDERGAWFSPLRGGKGKAVLASRGPAWQGYGAVGSTDPTSKRSQHDHHDPPIHGGRHIEYEDNEAPIPDDAEVKLKWTNARGHTSPQPQSHSAHLRDRGGLHSQTPSGPSSAESSSSAANRAPPKKSRKPRRLPSDAVDLIVEDDLAAQEEQTRERRKGEPAVRGSGLRKVYKQAFIAHSEDQPPVEVMVEQEPRGEEQLEETGEMEVVTSHPTTSTSQVEVITRAITPPLHARVVIPEFDDDNPWA